MTGSRKDIQIQNARMEARLNYFNTAPSDIQEKLALDAAFWRDANVASGTAVRSPRSPALPENKPFLPSRCAPCAL